MLFGKQNNIRLALSLLIAGVVLAGLAGRAVFAARSEAVKGPVIVVLDASWCAVCREINPVVANLASSQGVQLVRLDVDSANAPVQAGQYGITVNGGDMPQVYL